MLVLSRQRDKVVVIFDPATNEQVLVTVVDIRGDKVCLGFEAKRSIQVHRKEVFEAIQREQRGEETPLFDTTHEEQIRKGL